MKSEKMNTKNQLIKIYNGKIIAFDGIIENGILVIKNGIIESLTAGNPDIQNAVEIDAKGMYVSPGLIDNQVNGFAGVSFSLGGDELTMQGIEKATRELWKTGVTTYLPTLTTNSHDKMKENLQVLVKALSNPEIAASIPGFHLEGPYINPEDGYRGAHPLQFVRVPDWNEFLELYEAADHKIIQITLAPEVKGALEFISKCRELGVTVALGHHNAPTETVTEAVNRGAKIATHLGNGAANTINRHKNPFWSQLADDRLSISIICDGFHLLPEIIKVFYKVKGPDKTILTSDVTSFAMLDTGIYKTQTGEIIELRDDGLLHYPEQKCLYGSASPLTKSIENISEVTGCTLPEAIRMAGYNAAQVLGLKNVGKIKPGKRADLIFFTNEAGKIKIRKTLIAGKEVYNQI